MPTVSILSAVHNEALHIDEMIKSVQAQQVTDWELIFVDDGSTDSTVERIEQFAREDSRIQLAQSGIKVGKVAAFNASFAASTGNIIVMLSGDDRIPTDSLTIRCAPFDGIPSTTKQIALFKLRSFSDDPKFDGMIVPRGNRTNSSGGTIALSRALADVIFPIDETLVAEDIWLGIAALDQAEKIVRVPEVVLEYRIHGGNSNPRHKAFDAMSTSMHKRHLAWKALLDQDRFALSDTQRRRLQRLWMAEEFRLQGKIASILRVQGLPITDRLAIASKARPWTHRLRSRFYRLFSGWRGK